MASPAQVGMIYFILLGHFSSVIVVPNWPNLNVVRVTMLHADHRLPAGNRCIPLPVPLGARVVFLVLARNFLGMFMVPNRSYLNVHSPEPDGSETFSGVKGKLFFRATSLWRKVREAVKLVVV